jgi:hypothetical protein
MPLLPVSHTRWADPRRPAVDDAYAAWFNANSRCSDALQAWRDAAPRARADAHHAYLAELELEQWAAVELERLHTARRAA